MTNDIPLSITINRREVLTGVSALTAMALAPVIFSPVIAHSITTAPTRSVGAVLWDMPYLDARVEVAYQPCVGLRGAEGVAALDEALFRSHHIYA